MAKITSWLDWLDDAEQEYAGIVLSRGSELASETGVDPDPVLRPCEHRPQWYRGGLCLACDNTGLRRATPKERSAGLAYDPYLLNPPRTTYAVRRDESESSRRSAEMERLNAAISTLQRNTRLRAGVEVPDDVMMSLLRRVEHTRRHHPTLVKLGNALRFLRRERPDLLRSALLREEPGLMALSIVIKGTIKRPDSGYWGSAGG